jgi:hypothetical protein
MKKVIILAVVGLLVGIGGGTGIAVVLRPDVVADSTAADSSSAHNDTTAVIAAAPAGEHAPAAQPTDSVHADSTAAVKDTAHAAVKDPAHAVPVVDTTSHKPATAPILVEKTASDSLHRAQVRRIGRIFAAMAPREASKVLQQLDDSDVTIIVSSLTEKQAAAILQAFPPERAAAISRGSLRAAQQGQRP